MGRQTEQNRNRVIYSENPVLYADSLKKLAFGRNLQKIAGLRYSSVFRPELIFIRIHHF